jgi:hypothetical protein
LQDLDLHRAAGGAETARVDDQRAVGTEQPGPGVGDVDQPPGDLIRDVGNQVLAARLLGDDGPFAQGGGEHFRLHLERLQFVVDQRAAVFSEIE